MPGWAYVLRQPEQHCVTTLLSTNGVEPVSDSVKGRQHENVPAVLLCGWFPGQNINKGGWSCGAGTSLTPGLFSSAAAEEPRLSLLLQRLHQRARSSISQRGEVETGEPLSSAGVLSEDSEHYQPGTCAGYYILI